MLTINNNRRKLICVSRLLSMKKSAKIPFAQSKHFPPEHDLTVGEKKFIGTSSILA